MKTCIAATALAAALLAGPAAAEPWMAVDTTDSFFLFVDRDIKGVRIREARTLYVVKGRSPVVVTVQVLCDTGSVMGIEQFAVRKDMSFSPPKPEQSVMAVPEPGSVGAWIVANVCKGAAKNGAGWTRPTLREAIEAAGPYGYQPVWR